MRLVQSKLIPGARLCALVLAAPLVAGPGLSASAQDKRLDEVERALEQDQAKAEALERKARNLKKEIKALRRDLVVAAKRAQDLEDALSAKERTLAELEAEQAEKLVMLKVERRKLGLTLGALQRISLRPPEAALAAPGSPIDTVRSALLLSLAVPELERRAELLRRDLAALEGLRRDIALEREGLTTAAQSLVQERKRLATLIDRKRGLEDVTSAKQRAARERVRKLADEAKDLRDLVARLERESRRWTEQEAREATLRAEREAVTRADREGAERPEAKPSPQPQQDQLALLAPPIPAPVEKPGNVRPFPNSPAMSGLVMPARGRLISRFGQPDNASATTSKGISILTRRSAQVVASYDGRVVYAGRFRRYGQILIIEHGGRYHTLLAGLDRIDALEGQWVLAGEPVGMMSRAGDADPVLYLELRRGGQPINPLPWLATTSSKVQG